ncbi:MAG: hypothetical protein QM656_17945 [Paracoccaceae bacterium]
MKQLMVALALIATPAGAETISQEIARTGLGATETRLEALRTPTDEELFALGGVRFLGAVEQALQIRWRAGLTDRMGMLPFLRLPLPENSAPPPPQPRAIADLFRGVAAGMDAARMPLSRIPETSDFGLVIALDDLWFDINANGNRDAGEDLLDVAGPMILGFNWPGRGEAAGPVIRFDVADAAWLSAYTHLLGGISDAVLAYDPTAAIDRLIRTRAGLAALSTAPVEGADELGDYIDIAYAMIDALRQTPDKNRGLSAHAHFLNMIADNRAFWARVDRETDDDREWLPNDRQHAALGVEVPPGTGKAWLAVLDDFEALLKGEKLAPYWRVGGDQAGIDVGQLFVNPRPVDLPGWIQGADALPYLRKGPVVDGASWTAFEQMAAGQAMLFSLFLN